MMPREIGRRERRIPRAAEAQLIEGGEPPFSESVVTENISANGARLRCQYSWDVGLMVRFQYHGHQSQALVVYCERTPSSQYAVGLKFMPGDGISV
jgi:hypothetical protein